MALNVGMMCRVCSCDVAEEKRKDDQTRLIAQRRSRLATPSVTPGGGPGRHTPQTFQPSVASVPPRQYGGPPALTKEQEAAGMVPEEDFPEKKISPPPSEFDTSDQGGMMSPQPSYQLPPVSRRMEPSPRRPAAEPVTDGAQPPPGYYQLPPVQARSPPSKLV